MGTKFNGLLEQAVRFIERNQTCEVGLWQKFVEQYRTMPDSADGLWRCEYWGKMMRGACMVLEYTHDDGMYRIVEGAIRDMLTAQDPLGRFSTYKPDNEFFGWDMWGRKYILLGFQYFLPLCKDETLKAEIMTAICRHANYIIEKVGDKENQIPICQTSKTWGGMNSCSILEPMVRLYELTGEQKYLDFSAYIISTGFYIDDDLIELAYADEKAPYQYPVTKAYEMMSCFEGLIRYYNLTGIEKYKTAILNFGQKIIDTELSIIGCCGCTHELFDHTAVMQTRLGYDGVMQETCVGVTWIKFAAALLRLSDNPVYADCIEQTFYNDYLGSLNTHRNLTANHPTEVPQVMPFDSYSPLTPDVRGKFVGGYCSFPDHTFYGCCACIGAAGAGVIPQIALMATENGLTFHYYESAVLAAQTPSGQQFSAEMQTAYPLDGSIRILLHLDKAEQFAIRLRIPGWCREASLSVNGQPVPADTGYAVIDRIWQDGDRIELTLAMPVERILPPAGAENETLFAAYRRGPIVLAADRRITDPDAVIAVRCDDNGIADAVPALCPEIPDHLECYEVNTEDGRKVRLIDYASAGKTWDEESRCAAWLYRAKA